MHAVGQLRARTVDAPRYAHLRIFGEWPAVEDDDFFAGIEFRLDLLRRHARCILGVLDEFAERFTRNIDAAVQLEAFRCPCVYAAVQDAHVDVSMFTQLSRGALGKALPGVTNDHT